MDSLDNLKKTPLYQRHIDLGGKMVDFGGWALPVQYASGILEECKAVRQRAGLFDVSHMGEVDIIGSGAYDYIQKLVTNDITSMTPGRCRYAVLCYENGGAVDDVLIYKYSDDHYMFIVNAGNTDKDFAWMQEHVFGDVQVINNSAKWGQLALQGPKHQAVLDAAGFEGELPMKYYTFNDKMVVAGIPCLVSRTGYTGEDGVELYCAAEDTVALHTALCEAGKAVDAKKSAYRKLLESSGIDPKRIDSIMRVSDVSTITVGEDGKIVDADKVAEQIKTDWSDFVLSTGTVGQRVDTPPAKQTGKPEPSNLAEALHQKYNI